MGRRERNRETDFQIQVWMEAPVTRMIFATNVLALGTRRSSPGRRVLGDKKLVK